MRHAHRSIATALVPVLALAFRSTIGAAQATVDRANRYASVGAVMVWRVDEMGNPVELRGFASGTLIRDRVMVTAGHFTAPANALGTLPSNIRIFASFSPTDARDPKTWIPVIGQTTHPSMPHCPPPPKCDPTDEVLVAPLEPGIADVGLLFLAHAPPGVEPARLAAHGALARTEGRPTTIVGYGRTTPGERGAPPDTARWDGKRRIRISALRRVVDETWALWSIPSFVCWGDSGGGIFLENGTLAANVSDGGLDCRRHNNNNRLDTPAVQRWIDDAIRRSFARPALRPPTPTAPMSINADWHARHPMPKRATLEQRATWHVDHARHCACRPIPRTVQAAIDTRAERGRIPPAK